MAPLKPRQDLKARFVRNAIPTEQDFQDLIDSPLNQSDDGIFRSSGEPLSVVATNEPQRRCLRLYWDTPSGAAVPDWLISLNPPQTAAGGSNQRGLGIADGAGNTRLFLNAAGNLGVGTNQPQAKLHVAGGGARLDGPLTVAGASTLSGAVTASGTLTVGGEFTASSRVTLGRADGSTELVVRGALQAARSDIYFTKTDHQHTAFGNTTGFAAIENATNPYNALMILGRQTATGRMVKLWDYLQVNGNLDVNNGNLKTTGNCDIDGSLTIGSFGGGFLSAVGGNGEINLGNWTFRVNGQTLELIFRSRSLGGIGGVGGVGGVGGGVLLPSQPIVETVVARFNAAASGSNRLTYP